MPRPEHFVSANRVLKAPEGSMDIQDMHVHCDGVQCISFWRFSYEDWRRAVEQGGVFVSVLSGETQPPILVMTNDPFEAIQEPVVDARAQTPTSAAWVVRQLAAIKAIVGEPNALDRVRRDIEDFHFAFGHPVAEIPTVDKARAELRHRLIEEENKEFKEAQEARDLVAIADALTDLLYVVVGAMIEYGIPSACFEEVHRSNMSKLGADGKPILREDGKSLKGPHYSPPELAPILVAAGWTPPFFPGVAEEAPF